MIIASIVYLRVSTLWIITQHSNEQRCDVKFKFQSLSP